MYQCKQCRIEFPLSLKYGDYCTAYCRFYGFHWSYESHTKEHQDMKLWMEYNNAMLEESIEKRRENKIKQFMKSGGTHERPLITQKFKSETIHAKEYTTAIYETFEVCDCKGFVNLHKCWHVDELMKIYKMFN